MDGGKTLILKYLPVAKSRGSHQATGAESIAALRSALHNLAA
jgi:hypothetical protein